VDAPATLENDALSLLVASDLLLHAVCTAGTRAPTVANTAAAPVLAGACAASPGRSSAAALMVAASEASLQAEWAPSIRWP
jgi:hypothetical protein